MRLTYLRLTASCVEGCLRGWHGDTEIGIGGDA